ncbi:MAG: hypothetical protein HQL96_10800 [Magnetococcales bacterium]|nr:hypothetical protein [Magnetococcales bacterium]
MNMKPVLRTGLLLFLLLAWPSAGMRAAEPAAPPEDSRELFHFGNMGGLLPTLEANELKDAESPGAKAVYKYCSQCHNPPGPGMHTVEEWNRIFWNMIWRMQVMRGQFKTFQAPTYAESHQMQAYLSANALRAINAGDVQADAPGAKEFLKYCMQCHRLPAPDQHEATDWREVVQRMKQHMQKMSKHIPSHDDTDRIVTFLKSRKVKD